MNQVPGTHAVNPDVTAYLMSSWALAFWQTNFLVKERKKTVNLHPPWQGHTGGLHQACILFLFQWVPMVCCPC